MNHPTTSHRPARLVAPALVVAVLAFGLTRLVHTDRGATTSAPTRSGYPGPPTPTVGPATVTPPATGGLFPPPDVPHEVVSMHELPAAPALLAVSNALASRDVAALSALLEDEPIALDPLGDSEGYGVRLRPTALEGLLSALYNAGSAPTIQGAFGPGCLPRDETCDLFLVVTGWEGAPAFPTRSPEESIGRQPPGTLPTGAAVWELVPDSGDGLWWRAWYVSDGYFEAVERMADTHGTYYVIR